MMIIVPYIVFIRVIASYCIPKKHGYLLNSFLTFFDLIMSLIVMNLGILFLDHLVPSITFVKILILIHLSYLLHNLKDII